MNNYPDSVNSNDPNAPWNQEDSELEYIEKDVDISISLSKTLTIHTNDYIESVEEDWDVDIDETGNRVMVGGKWVNNDFSETDWKSSYINDDCYILTLLEEYSEVLKQELLENESTLNNLKDKLKEHPKNSQLKKDIKMFKENMALKKLKIEACKGYIVDDLEVFES